jgi:hypothetical protein
MIRCCAAASKILHCLPSAVPKPQMHTHLSLTTTRLLWVPLAAFKSCKILTT